MIADISWRRIARAKAMWVLRLHEMHSSSVGKSALGRTDSERQWLHLSGTLIRPAWIALIASRERSFSH
jgi:hypothetical protein